MKTRSTSKRALLTSVLSIALCLSMLIGTTFAWFTDTASTSVNKIQAGKLDVALEMKVTENGVEKWVTAEGETLNFVKAQGHEDEEILWEPGCTYTLPELRVVNNGNLALKYKVTVTGAKDANAENGKDDLILMNVLDWTYSISGNGGDAVSVLGTEHRLAAKVGDTVASDTLTIKAKMQESAGNDYQGLAIEGIAITVYATQDTVEYDSNGKDYDQDAAYPSDGLKIALAQGGNVTMSQNVTVDKEKTTAADRLTITKPTTLTLNGTLTSSGELYNSDNFATMFVLADTTIDAGSTGGLSIDPAYDEDGPYGTYGINVKEGATLTVNGGNFYCGGTAIQVQKGTLIVTGGHFEVVPFGGNYGYNFMLNCIDSAYKTGEAKIIVKGGTFVNFNPADCSAEGANTNFVDPDYKVVSETKDSGDIWYTVVKAN